MFKFSRKTDTSEEEKLALAIAKSLSLQASAGAADGSTAVGQGAASPLSTSPQTKLASPLVEIKKPPREGKEKEKEKDVEVSAPPLPESSMKVGNKTPDGTLITAELKNNWKRCIDDGRITDLEAKEMSYCDLVNLLGPCRRVLLSRRQIEEIHDDAIITGKIVIIYDGFIWYLLHRIKKLRHCLWWAHRRIRELEAENHRLEVEIAALREKVKGLEAIIAVLKEEISTLKVENERLTKAVDELSRTVCEQQKEIKQLEDIRVKLTGEVQYWKDKYEQEKKEAEKFKHLWHRCRKALKQTRDSYNHRRQEVVNILMQPLPDCQEAEGDEEIFDEKN